MPTLAIFGAGPALGLSTARRFARSGYAIQLVGRTPGTLAALAAQLEAEGAAVSQSVADLADPAQVRTTADRIAAQSGTPDVVLYSPGDVSRLPIDARSLDANALQTWLPLNLLSPVELTHAVIPGMVRRGSGALLVAQGIAVRDPNPAMASSSVAQAGLLNYLHALSADVHAHGVRIASLQIAQLIERSAAARLFDGGHFDEVETGQLPRIDPDQLAEQVWTIAHHGDTVEYRS
jgi:NADP-dependent 3-hydroxy acid dehydrogenase YdfG